MERRLDGLLLFNDALVKHRINLGVLIAETSLWANPFVHDFLVKQNGTGAWFPNRRRAKSGETRRQRIEDITLDDNTSANNAIKCAIGVDRKLLLNFEACHIWDKTAYDERWHTTIANLVLIPRPLAGLTDHDTGVQKILQFRAFELYGWYPEDRMMPQKPNRYPENWLQPFPESDRIRRSLNRRKLKG